jgi:hypothetical protein
MNTYVRERQYLPEFILEREMMQTGFVETIKTHILCLI